MNLISALSRQIAEFPVPFIPSPGYVLYDGALALVTALPYGKGEEAKPSQDHPLGTLAAFAQKNYYREHVRRLKQYAKILAGITGVEPKKIRIFSNSRLPEKRLAVEAGLGSRGKNSLVIIPGAGSLAVLGGLLCP